MREWFYAKELLANVICNVEGKEVKVYNPNNIELSVPKLNINGKVKLLKEDPIKRILYDRNVICLRRSYHVSYKERSWRISVKALYDVNGMLIKRYIEIDVAVPLALKSVLSWPI